MKYNPDLLNEENVKGLLNFVKKITVEMRIKNTLMALKISNKEYIII